VLIETIDETKNSSILSDLPHLCQEDVELHSDQIRIFKRNNGEALIFFEDYERLSEENPQLLVKVIHENGLDPDKIGFLIDESTLLWERSRLCRIARNATPRKKLFIRPLNTRHTTKMIREALFHLQETGDESMFDNYINEDSIKSILQSFGKGFGKGAVGQGEKEVAQIKKDVKSGAKKVAIGAALIGGTGYALNKIASKYADDDARKHPAYRSELIKKLRSLTGLLPEYEGKYARADRLSYQQKGIIGKIIHKIKAAIKAIKFKLAHLRGSTNPYYWEKPATH
jgi:hypothetical protein